ncbi:MAG: hypothetical protein ACOCZL_01280 [Bacteroidota bacterium]
MKTSRYFLLAMAVILLLPLAGHLFWRVQKKNPMNLMIINKTVPRSAENEVKTLNWVLNYRKILKNGSDNYDFSRDYYGFHPDAISSDRYIKAFRFEELPELLEKYDGLIYLDNEGVDLENPKFANLRHYGGLNNTDFHLLREMININKLVIVEDNFFSETTEDLIRFNTELLMDIYSLQWKGKYFKNLAPKKVFEEIEEKWLEAYQNFYQADWDFKGPGLVLFNSRQERIVVLPSDKYLNDIPVIKTQEKMAAIYNLPNEVKYNGWFNIIYEGKNEIISTLDLNLNDEGVEFLKKNGLEASFPIAVKMLGKPVFFLAGDFSKQNVFLPFSKIRIVNDVFRGVCKNMTGIPGLFFQNYYLPLMSGIISGHINYKSQLPEKEKT